MLIKTDASGDTLWTKTFGGGEGNSVQQTADGGYIVAGKKNIDVLLIKTDVSGDTLWTKTFDRGDSEWGNSVQQTADGGYIVTGYTMFCIDINYLKRVWLIKTDASGDSLWTKTFGEFRFSYMPGQEGWPFRSSVQQTTDGGYIVAGGSEFLLIKTDALGDTLWTKDIDGSCCSVQQTADGGYIVAGTNWDVLLIKIAPDLTNIQKKETKLVTHYSLSQNYPNPFNPSTTVEFSLPKSEFTTLKVFNILGKEVSTLVSKKLHQGNHTYQFGGNNLASGIYYYQLVAGDYREVKKMILLR